MRRRDPAIHFAGRFASKEAVIKALGTGHSQGVLWRDVEVVRRGGPPQLRLCRRRGGALRENRRPDDATGRSVTPITLASRAGHHPRRLTSGRETTTVVFSTRT